MNVSRTRLAILVGYHGHGFAVRREYEQPMTPRIRERTFDLAECLSGRGIKDTQVVALLGNNRPPVRRERADFDAPAVQGKKHTAGGKVKDTRQIVADEGHL